MDVYDGYDDGILTKNFVQEEKNLSLYFTK